MGMFDDIDFDAEPEKKYTLTPEGNHMANLEKAVAVDANEWNPPKVTLWWRIPSLNKVAFQDMFISKWDNSKQDFAIACKKLGVRDAAKAPGLDTEKQVCASVANALNTKTLHAEIYIKHTTSQNTGKTYENTYLNDVFEGEMRDDGVKNMATQAGIDANEELPF